MAVGLLAYAASPWRVALTLEGGVGLTAEERLDDTSPRFAAATGAVKAVWTFRPGTELTADLDLVADLGAGGNWRASSTTALAVALSRVLSLKLAHAVEYRLRPVAGFGRTDVRTAAVVVYAWRQAPVAR